MAIKPGTLGDFGGSMAEAIELQLNLMLIADGLPPLPFDSSQETRDRRRLFVAIARGVVGHLRDNQASILVSYEDDLVVKSTSATLSVTGI
jgi:hypothetical protein